MKKLLFISLALMPLLASAATFNVSTFLGPNVSALEVSNTVPVTNLFFVGNTVAMTNMTGTVWTNKEGIMFIDTNGATYGVAITNGSGSITNDVTPLMQDVLLWSDALGNVSTNWTIAYKFGVTATTTGVVAFVYAPIFSGPRNGGSGFSGSSQLGFIPTSFPTNIPTVPEQQLILGLGQSPAEIFTNYVSVTNGLVGTTMAAGVCQMHSVITVPGGTKGIRPLWINVTNVGGSIQIYGWNVSGYVP